jgi:hypothetical protein
MKFQEGDQIIVIATKEQGKVLEWINKKMLLIEVDGVSFPVYADQIDFPYFDRFMQPKKTVVQKKNLDDIKAEKIVEKKKIVDGVWLAFFPVLDKDVFDDDIISFFRIYLLNNTEKELNFDLSISYGSKKEMDLRKNIKSFEELYLFDLPFENLNDQPGFEFVFSPVIPEKKKVANFEVEYKPKAKQVFKKAEELFKEQKASFRIFLFEEFPDKPVEEKFDLSRLSNAGYKVYSTEKGRGNLPPSRTLIDLHIEKLIDDHKGLDPSAILSIQLNAFEKFYDQALLNHLSEVTVIHGVGTGKLKDEIHELLRLKKEVKSFINRYTPTFGWGATEIYLNF